MLVLPGMYAGSVDFKNSPVGRIEGGLYYMSVMNSILNNALITPMFSRNISLLGVLIFLGAIVYWACTKFRIKTGLVVLMALLLTVVGCGLVGFSYFSYLFDWHIFSGLLLFNGGSLLAARAVRDERQSRQVESALEGMVSAEVLRNIKNNPDVLYKRPNEFKLTILFIDIEGFSLRTRESHSIDVFRILHAQLDMITYLVHAHGGVVDRILGDGLMCYFGFSFEDEFAQKVNPSEHALRALRCAIEIQREAVRLTSLTQKPAESLGSVVPLRIGINTGDVFFGNLGSGKRLDFTIVGNAVNMAKRYEDACETFRILMGAETYRLLQEQKDFRNTDEFQIRPRLLALKHHEELVVGWECDPFSKNPELFEIATRKVREASGSDTAVRASAPHQPVVLRINKTDEGTLTDLNLERLTIVTGKYYCNKVYLNVEFIPESMEVSNKLEKANLKSIYVQVVTGSPVSETSFQHRVKIVHLSPDKLQHLNALLACR